jgi:SAM-dependent methyltransferase
VGLAFEQGLVCPTCRGTLEHTDDGWACTGCAARFRREGGVPNFVVGARFPDQDKLDLLAYEERANFVCAHDFYVPTIARLTAPAAPNRIRVASIGCGSAVDVDVLAEAGFDVVGFDCGFRSAAWSARRQADHLLLANGLHAPFRDGWFDVAIMGCVFPHIGVAGDSFAVAPAYRDDRLALARDVARIVRPGGHVVVSSPNRRFPLDLFHRHDPGRRVPRRTPWRDPFLLSVADYRDLFVGGAGCARVEPLPIAGYWGFVNMGATWRTRLLRAVLRAWFGAVSAVGPLRASPLAPWLCVHVVR